MRVLNAFGIALWLIFFATAAFAQFSEPRFKKGSYIDAPAALLCGPCQVSQTGGDLIGGDFAYGFQNVSVQGSTFSYQVYIRAVDVLEVFSTTEAFIGRATLVRNYEGEATGLDPSSCTVSLATPFQGTYPDFSGNQKPQYGISPTNNSLSATAALLAASPGNAVAFASLPSSVEERLGVVDVQCQISSSSRVAGLSLGASVGFSGSERQLEMAAQGGALSLSARAIAENNLVNYPLDGTTQYLTRADLHSDGGGVDLSFAEDITSVIGTSSDVEFSTGSNIIAFSTPTMLATSSVRYRFSSGTGTLIGGDNEDNSDKLAIARNGNYFGISASTVNVVPVIFYADAPVISMQPLLSGDNTTLSVVFNTGVYDDPVTSQAFDLVLTTTSSAISTISISTVTAGSTTDEFVLTLDTGGNTALGTEVMDIQLVLDGIGNAVSPYRAAYPFQTNAVGVAFNDLTPPTINPPVADYTTVPNRVTVTVDDLSITEISVVRVADEAACMASAFSSGVSTQTVGVAFGIGVPIEVGYSMPYCFRAVDVAGNAGFRLFEPLDLDPATFATTVSNTPVTSFVGGIGQTDIWVGFSETVTWRDGPTGSSATSVVEVPAGYVTFMYSDPSQTTVTTIEVSGVAFYPSVQALGGQQALQISLNSAIPAAAGVTISYFDPNSGGSGIYDTAGDSLIGNSSCGAAARTCNNETTTATATVSADDTVFAVLDSDGDSMPDTFENSNANADPFVANTANRQLSVSDANVALSAINSLPFSNSVVQDSGIADLYSHLRVVSSPVVSLTAPVTPYNIDTQGSGCDLSTDAFPSNYRSVCTPFDLSSLDAGDQVQLAWFAVDSDGLWLVDSAAASRLHESIVDAVEEVSFPSRDFLAVAGTGSLLLRTSVDTALFGAPSLAPIGISFTPQTSGTTIGPNPDEDGLLSFSGLVEGTEYTLTFDSSSTGIWAVSEFSSTTNPATDEFSVGTIGQMSLVWDNPTTDNNVYGVVVATSATSIEVGGSEVFAVQRGTTHSFVFNAAIIGNGNSAGTVSVPEVNSSDTSFAVNGVSQPASACNANSSGFVVTCLFAVSSTATNFAIIDFSQMAAVTIVENGVDFIAPVTTGYREAYALVDDASGYTNVLRDQSGLDLDYTSAMLRQNLAGDTDQLSIGGFAASTASNPSAALDATQCASVLGTCSNNAYAYNFSVSGVRPNVITADGVSNYVGGDAELIIPLPSAAVTGGGISLNKYISSWVSFSLLASIADGVDGDWGVSQRIPGGDCPTDSGMVSSPYRNSEGELNRGSGVASAGRECLYVRVRDGGNNDYDGIVNGVIVDPLGVAFSAAAGGGGGGGGALSWVAVAGLILLAALTAVMMTRRHRVAAARRRIS